MQLELASSADTGQIPIKHLKRYYDKSMLKRAGKIEPGEFADEWQLDSTLLKALGLGLEQTTQYLFQQAPTFQQFENWITETNGGPAEAIIDKFNSLFNSDSTRAHTPPAEPDILTAADHKFWEENGYVIVKNAVSQESCSKVIEAMCDFIGIKRYDDSTWYNNHSARQGIMVQLFQHPLLDENRNAPRVRKAFEELWGRTDLWVNTDRVGFNPPETIEHPFQGPRLHWDVSIYPPVPFGTQGLLYLADTAENQGAFTLVPGFQNKIEKWLGSLPEGADPRIEDLYQLGPKPIAASAGDLIIWHQALPHGSSPNTADVPRFVQYVNYSPADKKISKVWL